MNLNRRELLVGMLGTVAGATVSAANPRTRLGVAS
jgi:hypothetical protein